MLFNGSNAGDQVGRSVAGAGDVDGDGKADFIVGAPYAAPGGVLEAGWAYLFSGAGLLLFQKWGAAAGDRFGYSIAGAGDANGDGKADFIIGAPLADPGGRLSAGSAYLYSGATAVDRLGISVAGAGDGDGDGKADFIIGAQLTDPGGRLSAGSAYLYSGADGLLLYQRDGFAAGDLLGFSVAGTGDVNGDGRTDFIIGAPEAGPGGQSDAGSAYVMTVRWIKIPTITDIPNDQGKQLRISWKSFPGINDSLMDGFIVYRRIDSGMVASSNSQLTPGCRGIATRRLGAGGGAFGNGR